MKLSLGRDFPVRCDGHRPPAAYSRLAGHSVPTASEVRRHEREVATVLAMSPWQRRSLFDRATNPATIRRERGLSEFRGGAVVQRLKAAMMRLQDLRRAKP